MPTTVLGDGTAAFYSERHRADTDKETAEMLVSYACVCQQCLFKFVEIVLLLSFNLKHVFKTLLGSQRSHFFLKKTVFNDKKAIIQSVQHYVHRRLPLLPEAYFISQQCPLSFRL